MKIRIIHWDRLMFTLGIVPLMCWALFMTAVAMYYDTDTHWIVKVLAVMVIVPALKMTYPIAKDLFYSSFKIK